MKAYKMSAQALTENYNQSKELYIDALLKENIIDDEMANKMNQYCMVISEKKFFGKIWAKIFWKNHNEDMNISVIKIIHS